MHLSGTYEVFELPFCMRCPEAVVGAVNDVLAQASALKKLQGRIAKPFRYFEPVKGADSKRFPHIDVVNVSVQRANADYMGRYIEECIRSIPKEEFTQAADKNQPAVLIIGSDPDRSQVKAHLTEVGLVTKEVDQELSNLQQAYQILNEEPESNLGWRINDRRLNKIEVDKSSFARKQ